MAYQPIANIIKIPFSLVDFPCSEKLWNATSASQWHELWKDPRHKSPGSWSDNVEALLFGKPRPFDGLASLCLLVGLLIYIDELQKEAVLDPTEVNQYLRRAVDQWWMMHDRSSPDNAAINHLCYPAAYYLRIYLCVDARKTIDLFLANDFPSMRDLLRAGELPKAASHAMAALVPWCINRRNQSSMVAVPCGMSLPHLSLTYPRD